MQELRRGGQMSVYIGEVATFADVADTKEQAVKVLEEAAEVFGAWQEWNREGLELQSLKSECADLIQVTCNLLAAIGVPIMNYQMDECRTRNEERGRIYEEA